MELYTVIGMFNGGDIELFGGGYVVTHLAPGHIIYANGHYYRVYEDGRQGLRLWCVDVEVAETQARLVEAEEAPRQITTDEAQYMGYWDCETYPRGMAEVLRYLEVER